MIKKLYFRLTKHLPRRLPESIKEYEALKAILKKYFDLTEDEKVWLTISGQITATPPTKIRRSYASLANAGRRLNINKIAHDQKLVIVEQLETKLKLAVEKANEEAKAENSAEVREESPELSTPLQILQEPTE